MPSPTILVLAAHPDLRHSRVTRALMQAASTLGQVELVDLYAHYPDYLIDVPTEQARAARADLIVWLHPLHWYGMPPLMKLWLDEVFTMGWAYGCERPALAGKDLWLVTSTGGAEAAYSPQGYNRYFFDAFLPPYEQAAALCGLRFLPPLVLHGAHQVSEAELSAHVATWRARLASHPDWPEMADLADCPLCAMPPHDRPTDPNLA
ncbi:NAD(P)H-dependent oxidoreductase [Aquabacterium sp.]|uniref:glutathione-regulated potassium-efflux system oxidoreductase KefF n=1 Tax=Aquabacterium sp. TaxID=1872578 RepID=UPI0025C5FF99|nr:NAD(P)H-dependent oxidoreductase [Aquabacterium sp.]